MTLASSSTACHLVSTGSDSRSEPSGRSTSRRDWHATLALAVMRGSSEATCLGFGGFGSLEPDRYEGRPRKTRSGIPRVSRSRARSLWYGRSGFLPLAARFEESATDRNDDPIGTLIAEEDEVLVGLSL